MRVSVARRLAAAVVLAVVARTAWGVTIDPTAPGPYAVGFTTRTFTKASVTTGEPRVLETQIWYPAVPDSSASGAFADVVPGQLLQAVRDFPRHD